MSLAAFAVAVLASIVVLAPATATAKPAVDQYDLHIPTATGTGGGGSSTDGDGGSAPEEAASAASETAASVPVASTTPAEPAAPVATTSTGGDEGSDDAGKRNSDDRDGAAENTTASLNRSARSLPTIEDDAAGDVWLPILLAGLAGIGAVAGFLVYRRRRAHA